MSSDEAELGHRNLIAYSRAFTSWGRRGGRVEQDGVLAFAGGSWLPVGCNGAFRLSDAVAPSRVIAVADAFFAARKRGYCVQVRDNGPDDDLRQECEAGGMVTFGDPSPEMICRQRLSAPDLPAGVELRRVCDAAGVADFSSVNSEAYATYGMPTDVLVDMFDRPEGVLADTDTSMVLAYRDSVPVAAALVFLSDGIASLQWVGSRPAARGARLGEAVTVWATNEAFERGAAACTLQASTMGEPLYRKLGYETMYRYREFVRWRVPEVEGDY